MKNKDLRIGNLFQDVYNHVYEVTAGTLMYLRDADDEQAKNVKHILLSDQWLLKFGFAEKEKMYSIQHGCIKYTLTEDHHGFVLGIVRSVNIEWFCWEIKYVHQLQNLYFSLTGEELNIKSCH